MLTRGPLRWLLLCALTLVAGLLALASVQPGSVDDAFVLQVQARGLLEGRGWAYHGTGGPVECVTSLLDLWIKVGFLSVFDSDSSRTLWWGTATLYGSAMLLAVHASVRLARPAGGWLIALLALALALTPGLAEGTSYLLEAPLYAALILLGMSTLPRASRGLLDDLTAGVLACCLLLARPEGLAVATALLGGRWVLSRGPGRWRAPLLLAVGVAGLLGWRLCVFGTWAPNSYFAKASDSFLNEWRDGLDYLLQALSGAGGVGPAPVWTGSVAVAVVVGTCLVCPLLLSVKCFRVREEGLAARSLALTACLAMIVMIASGGDGYRGLRLFMPCALLALGTLGWVAARAEGAARVWSLAGLAVLVGARLAEILPGAPRKLSAIVHASPGEEDFACLRGLCQALQLGADGELIAQRHLQALKYFAPQQPVLDLTGLTDARIARTPAPGPVRFGRDALPEALAAGVAVIHLDHLPWRPSAAAPLGIEALLRRPELGERLLGEPLPRGELAERLIDGYRCVSLSEVCGQGTFANFLVRRDLLARFAALGFQVESP